jgi:hypothetical protein
LTVTIGIEPFNHLCQTAAGTVIAPGLLIPYQSDAEIERIVYDPPNRRFEASWRRRFTGALRRIIEIRDEHCQHHSGCDEPAARCDVDHITPHSDGGATCLCNGQLLCAHHNRTIKAATDKALHRARRPAPTTRCRARSTTQRPGYRSKPTWPATPRRAPLPKPANSGSMPPDVRTEPSVNATAAANALAAGRALSLRGVMVGTRAWP